MWRSFVRVDLLKALLLGAGQMERVTRSDEDGAPKVEDGLTGGGKDLCVEGMDDECHRRRLAGDTAIEKCSMDLPVVKGWPVAKRRQQQ